MVPLITRETCSALNAISSSFENSDKSEQDVINTTERYNSVLEQQKSLLSSLDGVYDGYAKQVAASKEKIAELTQKRDEEGAKLQEIEKKFNIIIIMKTNLRWLKIYKNK